MLWVESISYARSDSFVDGRARPTAVTASVNVSRVGQLDPPTAIHLLENLPPLVHLRVGAWTIDQWLDQQWQSREANETPTGVGWFQSTDDYRAGQGSNDLRCRGPKKS